MCEKRNVGRAATLVELAAIAVATTVLIGVALPLSSEARRQGKEVHCLHNLGRIASAGAVYAAADADGTAIPVHRAFFEDLPFFEAYAYGGKSGSGDPVAGDDPLNSRWSTVEGLGPSTRPLNRIVFGDVFPDHQLDPGLFGVNWQDDAELDLGAFRCPADFGYTGIHYRSYRDGGMTSYDHFGTSYSANSFWIGSAGSNNATMRSNSPYLHRLDRIVAPSRTLLYEENCGRFAWMRSPDPCPLADGLPGTVDGWHGAMWTFNVAFSDGHADRRYIEGYQPYDIGRYVSGGNFASFQCILIRGNDWQKDTLPLPDVATGLPVPSTHSRPSQEGGVLE